MELGAVALFSKRSTLLNGPAFNARAAGLDVGAACRPAGACADGTVPAIRSSTQAMHARRTLNSAPMIPTPRSVVLLLVQILWQPLEFFQEYERPVRRDLKALAAGFTDEVVVYPNQVILRL